jgi:hypothetical protein
MNSIQRYPATAAVARRNGPGRGSYDGRVRELCNVHIDARTDMFECSAQQFDSENRPCFVLGVTSTRQSSWH